MTVHTRSSRVRWLECERLRFWSGKEDGAGPLERPAFRPQPNVTSRHLGGGGGGGVPGAFGSEQCYLIPNLLPQC